MTSDSVVSYSPKLTFIGSFFFVSTKLLNIVDSHLDDIMS